ncbi:MAG TPA: hypothetical protein VJA21_01515 [Verrucomicrobiae bacterium]
MSSTKIAAILSVALFVAGLVAMVRHGRMQPAETTTFEPQRTNDFKKPETAELKQKMPTEHRRTPLRATPSKSSRLSNTTVESSEKQVLEL